MTEIQKTALLLLALDEAGFDPRYVEETIDGDLFFTVYIAVGEKSRGEVNLGIYGYDLQEAFDLYADWSYEGRKFKAVAKELFGF